MLRAVGMLKPEEAHFVNDVWAELDTMWGDIASMEERLSGVAPKKQDSVPSRCAMPVATSSPT